MIKHQRVLICLIKLGRDYFEAKDLVITPLHDSSLYISSEKDTLLMLQAAGAFVNVDHENASFHTKSFLKIRQGAT